MWWPHNAALGSTRYSIYTHKYYSELPLYGTEVGGVPNILLESTTFKYLVYIVMMNYVTTCSQFHDSVDESARMHGYTAVCTCTYLRY